MLLPSSSIDEIIVLSTAFDNTIRLLSEYTDSIKGGFTKSHQVQFHKYAEDMSRAHAKLLQVFIKYKAKLSQQEKVIDNLQLKLCKELDKNEDKQEKL